MSPGNFSVIERKKLLKDQEVIYSNPGYELVDHDKSNEISSIFNKGQSKESHNISCESFLVENIIYNCSSPNEITSSST